MNVVMMGVQGSGKGTQSKLLSKDLGVPHVSVGDIFRAHIAEGTDLGDGAQKHIKKGELVPDGLVIDMVKERLGESDARDGVILDGFPRNGVQLAAMELMRPVDHAVLLDLDEESAVERLGTRSECRHCGILYGANRRPREAGLCDECGEQLSTRSDDSDRAAVKKRVSLYYQEIDVLVRYYDWKGVLRRVDGRHSEAVVHQDVRRAVQRPG